MNVQIVEVQKKSVKLPKITNILFVKNAIKSDLHSNGFKINIK